ncbi:MAG: hypothetical protein JWP89_2235 [Schlesneria sp.]|nr:hypothetical protein [Schlesneria sp.]
MTHFSVSSFQRGVATPRTTRRALWQKTICGLVASLMLATSIVQAGTWTPLSNSNPEFFTDTMLLLTDGSVMVLSGNDYRSWTKLTPDATGSYVNGTWSYLPSMSTNRQNFASTVLTDGRVMVLGGQFSGPSLTKNDTNTGTIYNPVTNKWTTMTAFPEPKFGAGPAVLHPFGYVLAGGQTAFTHFYYPPSDFWFTFGSNLAGDPKLRTDVNTEETWLLLPDNNILSYDVNASITNTAGTAQKFSYNSDAWVDAGTLTALLTTATQKSKVGPGSVLPNGKVIQIGGNEATAIYTPPVSSAQPGTWVAGPSLPVGMGADDAPGAMLPDGHFLFLADFYPSTSPTMLFDYDYVSNTITNITATLPSQLQSELSFTDSSTCRMLVLPDGGLLLSTGGFFDNIWVYKTSGTPLATWKPTISSVSKTAANTYQVIGSQLNGISEGATFGNNARMSTNYPIVKLTSTGGIVRYARTSNWNAGISRPGSGNFGSFNFQAPAGLPAGTYNVSVIANGIASPTSLPLTIQPGLVTASFANGVLTVTGDGEASNITMTYKQTKTSGVLTSATVTIAANDIYTMVNGTSSVVLNVGTARFNANVDMGAGDDSVTFNSFYSQTINLQLGLGNDTASFLYNSIYTLLSIDGGAGSDVVTFTGNSIIKQTVTNVP